MEVSQVGAESFSHIPIIDIRPLFHATSERHETAARIGRACRDSGFFYIVGHRIDDELQKRLEQLSRQFFAQDIDAKLEISMSRGGRAWRGYFPVGGELTSGKADLKEGIYFAAELEKEHPSVKAGLPLHGPNLFPSNIRRFGETVLDYMAAMTELGHTLMRGLALSLGLEESYFADRYTSDPLTLFRIFNYPPQAGERSWGVGEHTDYGLLTILKQDESGGLQVKSKAGWIDALPVRGSFVCNIGDMLDRMTGGLYRSTPHRVENRSGQNRLSFPFFFDPNFNAEVRAIEGINVGAFGDDKDERWDASSVHEFRGTYGEYLLNKVSRVFPQLRREVL
jgi:isopenicillin N synthase-like dioxygenase